MSLGTRDLCISLCMCVLLSFAQGHTLAKIKKVLMTFIDFDICLRMAPWQNDVLHDLGLPFQGQTFEMFISSKRL